MISNVLPVFSSDDVTNIRSVNSVLFAELPVVDTPLGVPAADLQNLNLSKGRNPAVLTRARNVTARFQHVPHVFGLSPNTEMIWIDAQPDVTRMPDHILGRHPYSPGSETVGWHAFPT